MTSPLEVLEEMREGNLTVSYDGEKREVIDPKKEQLISFAIAVLEMKERPNGSYPFLPGYQAESAGYNAALAEVHKLAKEKMGVEE